MNTEKMQEIIEVYKDLIATKKDLPNYLDFKSKGITKDTIRHHCGGILKLHEIVSAEHGEFIDRHLYSVEKVFEESRSAANTTSKRVIVTTAVAGAKAHKGFISALRAYAAKHSAQIIIMPCESVTNSFENKSAVFDTVFFAKDFLFVQENTKLNDNLSLCSIQVSAKQIKPTTGLSRLGNREGSYIFASPKQFLDYYPSGNKRGSNYSIMTPGACTMPEYYSETYISKRLSYIAENDHTLGAIIIELDEGDTFHFRQVQADATGSFIDMGIQYNEDGSTLPVAAHAILGDIHGVQVDIEALGAVVSFLKKLDIKSAFLHDTFDGQSISHHTTTIGAQAKRSINKKNSLEQELNQTYNVVKYIDGVVQPDSIFLVKSNHDEVIDRYLAEGRYVDDPENHYLALKIATAPFEGVDPLARGFEVAGNEVPPHWNFLGRESSIRISGVECGSHGDLGLNGAKPSLNTFETVYGNCIIGHAHTAAIQRGVFRVGTLSKLDMGYNRGPTSWTHTFCLLYDNGQRQLINVINEKVHA